MNDRVLYVGVASPLVEVARAWIATIPPDKSDDERRELLIAFPAKSMGAYQLTFSEGAVPSAVAFRTGMHVSEETVRQVVHGWCELDPERLPDVHEPVPDIQHRRALDELLRVLKDQPIRVVARVGLTLKHLHADLRQHTPELIMLSCHGTNEGCLLFEDGRGKAYFVPGEQLFGVLKPRPKVLHLSACYSEAVLNRAKDLADWLDAAIVHVNSDTPIEVAACVAFDSMFYPALLRGNPAGEAFDDARLCVENDPNVGKWSGAAGGMSPSEKFRINETGRVVRLSQETAEIDADEPQIPGKNAPHRSDLSRRASGTFVGRRREMANCLDSLLPLDVGIVRGPECDGRRLITLTKEGGIGKTTLATKIADWAQERGVFPGGVFELSCERLTGPDELASRLLTQAGVPPEGQRGNLLDMLRGALIEVEEKCGAALVVLDNLDDLVGKGTKAETRQGTCTLLEAMLAAAQDLRILATCRWPVGIAEHEHDIEIGPMNWDEATDVFVANLKSQTLRETVRLTRQDEKCPVRQLVALSGRHPQSLQLLARQMGRPGMTLERLRNEARENLIDVLSDPLASDDDEDRLKKVERSYELSYRHLSDEGKCLFQRMSRLPGGVWRGELADEFVKWEGLLGENWRVLMEKELNYYALVHFVEDHQLEGHGTFEILNPMREFAADKFAAAGVHDEWEKSLPSFWREHLVAWNSMISGRVPDISTFQRDRRAATGAAMQQVAKVVFDRTQANWLLAFEYALEAR